jgi:hypothetical protein
MMVRVRPGENLRSLSRAYRLARDRLRQINGISDEADVTPGTMLFLPRGAKRGPSPAAKPTKPAAPKKK